MVSKKDAIQGELNDNQIRKNDFLVAKKITKVEVFGKDPFCRVPVSYVNEKLAKDKTEAITIYRQEAGERLTKKVNEKAGKKDIIKNENLFELEEREKKEALKKKEKEEQRQKQLIASITGGKGLPAGLDIRRVSKLQSMGAMAMDIEKMIKEGKFNFNSNNEDKSTDRPLVPKEAETTSPRDRPIKQGYKKGEFIPNLQTLKEEKVVKKGPKGKEQTQTTKPKA